MIVEPSGQAQAVEGVRDTSRSGVERRIYHVMLIAAVASLIIALWANWPLLAGSLTTPYKVAVAPPGALGGPAVRIPVNQLPSSLLGYETIARQLVPGSGGGSVEGVYTSLDMNVELATPIAIYARADGGTSDIDAQRLVQERMKPFSLNRSNVPVGKITVGQAGFTPDQGSYAIGWARGSYAYFVKSTFKDKIPAQKRDFLRSQARPAAERIEAYLESGKKSLKL